jgi:chromosome partitioning protein
MTIIIGMISQKGGVGKSTLARLIAREYASSGWKVKIADLDVSQGTSTDWKQRREQEQLEPEVAVEPFRTTAQALKIKEMYDLLIFDGAPHSMSGTLDIARASSLVVLPTGLSLDDLRPSIMLAHELIENGIPNEKIIFGLCRVGDRDNEIQEARTYIERAGYQCAKGSLPEKTGYRRASDEGRALSEVSYKSLKERAHEIAQSIIDTLSRVSQ